MADDTIRDDELDAIVAQLEKAGLIETHIAEDGREACRLTKQGESVGRALAMAGDDDAAALLDSDAT